MYLLFKYTSIKLTKACICRKNKFLMKHINHLSTHSYFINRFGKSLHCLCFTRCRILRWQHATKLGFGYDHLEEMASFWVLSKLWVKNRAAPGSAQDFTLETWSRGTDGFLATAISILWIRQATTSFRQQAAGWC